MQAPVTQSNRSDGCSSVDLRGAALGPARNQGNIGWCYAFTAADLVSQKLGVRVSAADIAFQYTTKYSEDYNSFVESLNQTTISAAKSAGYSNEKTQKMLQKKVTVSEGLRKGGEPREAISYTQKGGFCLEKNLPSQNTDLERNIENIEKIENHKRNLNLTNQLPCAADYDDLQRMFPNLRLSDYLDILKRASIENIPKLMADRTCQPRIKSADLSFKRQYASERKDRPVLFNKLDEQLNKKTAVGIVYNAEVITEGSTEDKTNHASIVVARKYNPDSGFCEYLVRNSWGPSCDGYTPIYKCEQGNIWVPKEALMNSMNEIDYIE